MARRVLIRSHVPGDLHGIIAHIQTRSPKAAGRFADAITPTIQFLSQFPGAGSLKQFRSKRLAGLRSWRVIGFPNHLVLYRIIDPETIEILGVLHGAQSIGRILRKRS